MYFERLTIIAVLALIYIIYHNPCLSTYTLPRSGIQPNPFWTRLMMWHFESQPRTQYTEQILGETETFILNRIDNFVFRERENNTRYNI